MDADLSHNPSYLPALLAGLGDHEVMVGSRYVRGGGVVNWPLARVLLSWCANRFARTVLGLPSADLTSGFRAYRVSLLARLHLDTIRSNGYSFLAELQIPRSLLDGAERLEIGGHIWQEPSLWVQEDIDGDGIGCPCAKGTSLLKPVKVDVKPKNANNCMNLGAESTVRVAILADGDFDPNDKKLGVICTSITFLGVATERCRVEEAGGDSRKDLVAYYKGRTLLRKGKHDCAATQTEILGVTVDGIPTSGFDTICYLGNEPCP